MIDPGSVVDFLEAEDALRIGDSYWRTREEGDEVYEFDWGTFFSDRAEPEGAWDPDEVELEKELADLIGAGSGRTTSAGPGANGVDVVAWYQPMHFFAHDWGIFIRRDGLNPIARMIARRVNRTEFSAEQARKPVPAARVFRRAAFLCLYFHEYYHHRIECLGIRLHVALRRPVFLRYGDKVYRRALAYRTLKARDKLLEEALANAHSYLKAHREKCFRPFPSVQKAICDYLEIDDFKKAGGGYRRAVDYLNDDNFDEGENLLQGQVREGSFKPKQPAEQWNFAPLLTRGFFSRRSNIWWVVPPGARAPQRAKRYTCSTAELETLFIRAGYRRASGGKGSHIKMAKHGRKPMIIPLRRGLSPGVLNEAVKRLGPFNISDLPGLLDRSVSLPE